MLKGKGWFAYGASLGLGMRLTHHGKEYCEHHVTVCFKYQPY